VLTTITFSYGQGNIDVKKSQITEREKLGLQQIDSSWKLVTKNFVDTAGRIITDTTAYQVSNIIEHWRTTKNERLKLNKVIQYDFLSKKITHETDVYKKYLPGELMVELYFSYNYVKKELSATIDTTIQDEIILRNQTEIQMMKQDNPDLCGTAIYRILYNGYDPTISFPLTEHEAKLLIEKWLRQN
jgi:hypothetical protein